MSVSPLSSSKSLETFPNNYLENWIRTIQIAQEKGHFEAFQKELSQSLDGGYCQIKETWGEWINHLTEKEGDRYKVLICFLFATAIDTDIGQEKKTEIMSEALQSLHQEGHEIFYFSMVDSTYVPTPFKTHILPYLPLDNWEKVFQTLLDTHVRKNKEWGPLISWIEEVVENPWELEGKQKFFDRLFNTLPPVNSQELCYFLLLKNQGELKEKFLSTCSEQLKNQLALQEKEISDLLENYLTEAEGEIPFEQEKRRYFLEQFYEKRKEHPNAFALVFHFGNDDWDWMFSLKPQGEKLTPLAMRSMVEVVTRLSVEKLTANEQHFKVLLQSFFSGAIRVIKKEKGWETISDKAYADLAKKMPIEVFYNYFEGWDSRFQTRLISCLAKEEKEKLGNWFETIKDCDTHVSKKITDLISLLSSNSSLQEVIQHFVSKLDRDALMVTIFCSLDENYRCEVLQYLGEKKEDVFVRWFFLCNRNQGNIAPYICDDFTQNILPFLEKHDPLAASNLKERVALSISSVDLNTPLTPQEKAIQKLKDSFLIPNVPHEERERLVFSLQEDLKGGEKFSIWFPNLLNGLPEATWPLVIYFFERDISSYAYKENPKGKESIHWEELLAKTLNQMVENSLLDEAKIEEIVPLFKSVIKALLSGKQKFSTIQMYQHFFETSPPVKWISVLSLRHLEETAVISAAINKNPKGKIDWMAEALEAEWERRWNCDLPYQKEFEQKLWSKNFLKSENKFYQLFKTLYEKKGSAYLAYYLFENWNASATLLKGIRNKDDPFFESCFVQGVQYICSLEKQDCQKFYNIKKTKGIETTSQFDSSGLTDKEKISFILFQEICTAFSCAGLEVFEVMQRPELQKERGVLQKWYSQLNLNKNSFHFDQKAGLQFLKFFRKSDYFSIIQNRIQAEVMARYPSFHFIADLLKHLEEREEKEHIISQLDPKTLEAFHASCKNQLMNQFYSPELGNLICQLVPSWKEDLLEEMEASFNQSFKDAISMGKRPNYSSILDIFQWMQEDQRGGEFFEYLRENASYRFKSAFESIEGIG